MGNRAGWMVVEQAWINALIKNPPAHVLGPLHFIWWIEAKYKPSTQQELRYLNFDLTKLVQEKNC